MMIVLLYSYAREFIHINTDSARQIEGHRSRVSADKVRGGGYLDLLKDRK
jgi:hypothetical protein